MFSFTKNDIIVSVLADLMEGRLSNLKRISCYVFALLLFMQSFLIYTLTEAAVPVPTPTNGCSMIRESSTSKIKCTYASKSVTFSHDGDYGNVGGLKYQFWVATVGTQKYYLLVSADPVASYNDMKVEKVAITVPSMTDPAYVNANLLSVWDCIPLTNGEAVDSSLAPMARTYIIHTDHEGWSAIDPPSPSTQPTEISVLSTIATNAIGSKSITVAAYSRTAPLAANLASCGTGKLTQPITSIAGGVEKYVADIKKRWMENITPLPASTDKEKAIAVIDGMLADPNDLYSSGIDIDLFKRFYDSTYVSGDNYPPKYPNVIIGKDTTDAVYKYYTDLESSLSSRAASSNFDARTFMFMVGPVLKAGGISMYQLDALPLWTTGGLGALTDVTIKYLVNSNIGDARNIVKDQLKIYFGHLYLKNNLVFNKCLAGKTPPDPFAFDTVANLDKIIANVDAILESSFQDLNAFATADQGKTVCDGLKGNYIVVMLKQAFCGLLLITKQWADTAYNASMQLLATSIGVATDVTSVPTTDSAETINVGPNAAGDSSGGAAGSTPSPPSTDANPTGGETVTEGTPTDTSVTGTTTLKGVFQPSGDASAAQVTAIGLKMVTLNGCAAAGSGCTPSAKIRAVLKNADNSLVYAGTWIPASITFGTWNIASTENRFTATVIANKAFNGKPYQVAIKISYGSDSINFGGNKATIDDATGNSKFYTMGY